MGSALSSPTILIETADLDDPDSMDMHEWRRAAAAAAALGFSVRRFTSEQMISGILDDQLALDSPVIGQRSSMLYALRQLAVIGLADPLPERDDYPPCLRRRFMGRKVWPETLARALDTAAFQKPIFLKPRGAANTKRFSAVVLDDANGDAWRLGRGGERLPPTLPVWCSDVISLQSEWRCYVLRGKAISVCYSGNELEAPLDAARVDAMIALLQRSGEGSAAYALDVGVVRLDDGSQQTVLVEVNDGFALGLYPGCPDAWYVAMMAARWQELVEPRRPSFEARCSAPPHDYLRALVARPCCA